MHLVGQAGDFFRNKEFEASSIEERRQVRALEPVLRLETEHKVCRIVKDFLSVVFVLPLIYRGIRAVISWIVVASTANQPEEWAGHRVNSHEWGRLANAGWRMKRFTIEVNGMTIDAVILSKPETVNNGRWVLHSTGNGGCYDAGIVNYQQKFLEQTESNMLFFNYPGVVASTGNPHASALVDTYEAFLAVLENKDWGMGATEIIGYGFSLGSGVQGEALSTHEFQEGTRYLFIKDQSYTRLVDVIAGLLCRCLGWIVQLFGNNLNVIESSRRLHERGIREIVMEAENDELMTPEIRLWANLTAEERSSKVHISYPGGHSSPFPADQLAARVNEWIAEGHQEIQAS